MWRRWEIFYRGWAICFDGDAGFAADGSNDDDESGLSDSHSLENEIKAHIHTH